MAQNSTNQKGKRSNNSTPIVVGLAGMTEDLLSHARCFGCPLAVFSGDGDEVVDCNVGELDSIHCPGPANETAV